LVHQPNSQELHLFHTGHTIPTQPHQDGKGSLIVAQDGPNGASRAGRRGPATLVVTALADDRKFRQALVEAEGDQRPTPEAITAGVSMPKPHSVTPKPPASAADLIAHVVISVAEAGQLLGLSRSSAYQAVQ
jgi:hypothetical protein